MTGRKLLTGSRRQVMCDLLQLAVVAWLGAILLTVYTIVLPEWRGWIAYVLTVQMWFVPLIMWGAICLPLLFPPKRH